MKMIAQKTFIRNLANFNTSTKISAPLQIQLEIELQHGVCGRKLYLPVWWDYVHFRLYVEVIKRNIQDDI